MFSNARVNKPEIFRLIEKNDELLSLLLARKIIPLDRTVKVVERKRELIRGAEQFVSRQKKGP